MTSGSTLLTRWGRTLQRDSPWPEHPRPQLERPQWLNLNGLWDYAITATAERPEHWDGEIVVPFSPEAPLSGVNRQLQPNEWLWYQRRFTAPVAKSTNSLTLLHFGAVDQSCTVWVNGVEVGHHVGGYLPFTLDITDALIDSPTDGDALLEVRVRDLSEHGPHARGKQRLDRGTIWYTAQSGIWQTVWAESVPARHVESLTMVPDLSAGVLEVTAHTGFAAYAAPVQVVVRRHGKPVGSARGMANLPVPVQLSEVHLWSPEDPHLYDVEVTLGAGPERDVVTSYAAMRSFGVGRDDEGKPTLLLNGSPYLHVGVLDQGYWPDGLLTPPSDEAMVHDIEAMKALGFTMLRKHVKIEPLRWYAHCDRIGMLVWQDMVNGGGRYRHLVTTLPATRPVRISDRRYAAFFREDADARDEFRDEVRRTIALLRNVASIAVWVPFNEGWGQFDANDIATEVRAIDPTRQVNHVSGWVDQGGGDIRSFHRYLRPFRMPRLNRGDRVVALTEYGGYSLRVAGHDWSDREFGYRHCEDRDELAAAFGELHEQLAEQVRRGLAATVYTQLSDVEDELNGLFTWDREVLKVDADTVRAALRALRG